MRSIFLRSPFEEKRASIVAPSPRAKGKTVREEWFQMQKTSSKGRKRNLQEPGKGA
jgi:hypothetical protein